MRKLAAALLLGATAFGSAAGSDERSDARRYAIQDYFLFQCIHAFFKGDVDARDASLSLTSEYLRVENPLEIIREAHATAHAIAADLPLATRGRVAEGTEGKVAVLARCTYAARAYAAKHPSRPGHR